MEAAVIDAGRQDRSSLTVVPFEVPEAPSPTPGAAPRRACRPNRWVILDRAWAERLGVQRQGGVYRIRSRELQERLASDVAAPTCGGVPRMHLRVRIPPRPAAPAGHQLS
jgi:hypothetical protein